MRRLKNIAENLEAIFRKREQEQEKTLNLQSLEERVLYSAVPLPVDLADAVANPQEPVDVGDLAAGQVEANVTSTLDQLDDLIADEATPELSGTIFTKPLPDDASERLGSDPYDPYETGEDPAESTSIPLTVDAPVAANLRVAVFGDFASFSINEGEVLQILDTSLDPLGVPGETLQVRSISAAGGTFFQAGDVLEENDFISSTALENGDILFIPDVNFTGDLQQIVFDTEGGIGNRPESYQVNISVLGAPDDGVAVLGDNLTPVGDTEVFPSGTDSDVVGLQNGDGSYVVVYSSSESDPEDRTVFVQRFNGNGTLDGDRIEIETKNGAFAPEVAALRDGGFVVAVQGDVGDRSDIFLQRFNSSGDPVDLNGDPQSNTASQTITLQGLSLIHI